MLKCIDLKRKGKNRFTYTLKYVIIYIMQPQFDIIDLFLVLIFATIALRAIVGIVENLL